MYETLALAGGQIGEIFRSILPEYVHGFTRILWEGFWAYSSDRDARTLMGTFLHLLFAIGLDILTDNRPWGTSWLSGISKNALTTRSVEWAWHISRLKGSQIS